MFATSSRQPSRSNGGPSQRRTTLSASPRSRSRSERIAVVELRQRAHAGPRLVPVAAAPSSQKKSGRSTESSPPCALVNHAWSSPDVVDRQVADHAASRVRVRRERARPAPRRRRAAGRPRRRTSRCSGGWSAQGRTASCRGSTRPIARDGPGAPRSRRDRRRTTRAASSAPSRSGRRPSPGARPTRAACARPARAREAVGEDLVDDALDVPGRAVVSDRGEVVRVGDVVADQPRRRSPSRSRSPRPRAASDRASPGCPPGRRPATRSRPRPPRPPRRSRRAARRP